MHVSLGGCGVVNKLGELAAAAEMTEDEYENMLRIDSMIHSNSRKPTTTISYTICTS